MHIDDLNNVLIFDIFQGEWIDYNYDIENNDSCFSEDRAWISEKSDDVFALIDRKGNLLTDFIYIDASDFINGYCFLRKKDSKKFGVLNKYGKVVFPFRLIKANDFTETYANVWDERGSLMKLTKQMLLINPDKFDEIISIVNFSEYIITKLMI